MLVVTQPDVQSVSLCAADMIAGLMRRNPQAVIGLAAGATPLGLYDELVRRHHDEGLDFSQLTVFGLDEYLGIAPDHPASCGHAIRSRLIERVNLAPSQVHLMDGRPSGDLFGYCTRHEEKITKAGGLDLQILGLGINGHVGFNEPGSSLGGRTGPVILSTNTRTTNRPAFPPHEETPKAAITMGVATILAARRILLLATGAAKADAVAKMIEGPLTAMVPASALQLHPDAVILLDTAAAGRLLRQEKYDFEVAAQRDLGAFLN